VQSEAKEKSFSTSAADPVGTGNWEMHYDENMGSAPPILPPHQHGPEGGYAGTQPEILSPGVDYAPPVPPQRRRRRAAWAASPATYLLIGINCAVFLAMVAHHISPVSPTPDQLYAWQADSAGAVLINGQWWRIVTAMFVHVGIVHLATNMWCLWNLGLLAEPLMGTWGVLAVYLLTGAAGNLLSTLWSWVISAPDWARYHDVAVFSVGAGASGAVFGIAGALIVLLKSPRLPVPAVELKRLRRSVIYFSAINLVLPFTVNYGAQILHAGLRIDISAHVGGFACGLLFAAPMVPRLGSPRSMFRTQLGLAVGMIIAVLVLFGFYLAKLAG
jgi:rhomboid protease GluP